MKAGGSTNKHICSEGQAALGSGAQRAEKGTKPLVYKKAMSLPFSCSQTSPTASPSPTLPRSFLLHFNTLHPLYFPNHNEQLFFSMGFWDSLVEGAKSAGGWVLDHSGDIASAVGTVAKIAGAFAFTADEEIDHATHLEEFHTNFKTASLKLQKAARDAAGDATASAQRTLSADFAASNQVRDSVTGVWKNPAPLLDDGTPAVPMYQDLSKWISALGVPANDTLDTAFYVGQALFADTNNALKAKTMAEGGDFQVTKFPYTDPNGKWTLDCGHAFYPLPLGAASTDNSWHSCIYGIYHPSNAHLEAKRSGELPSTAFVKPMKTGVPVWVVNAAINWGNAVVASTIHSQLTKLWEQNNGKQSARTVVSSALNGVCQSVQVQGDLSDNPAKLRQSLITCAANVLSQYSTGQKGGGGGGDKPSPDTDPDNNDLDDGTDPLAYRPAKKMNGANGVNGHVKRTAVKPRVSAAVSDMPTTVPDVRITKSQIVFIQ